MKLKCPKCGHEWESSGPFLSFRTTKKIQSVELEEYFLNLCEDSAIHKWSGFLCFCFDLW